jgi:DNA replication protein DnaC
MLKALRHARLDATHEAELRKLLSVDLLILDDFGLDAMDATESRDLHGVQPASRLLRRRRRDPRQPRRHLAQRPSRVDRRRTPS